MIYQTLYLIISASVLVYLAKFDHYGLYIAIALFWVISAFYKPLTSIAIWSIVVFMAGFALMRIINIAASGIPSSYYFIFNKIFLAMKYKQYSQNQ
ncbi:MAG: hypothetical protein EBW26_03265 [Proteobacteria bacterium]|nr:hypothetical protein [Pseudomonadota bacterium]